MIHRSTRTRQEGDRERQATIWPSRLESAIF